MPNNITNRIRINTDDEKIKEILEAIKLDEKGIGSIDFEKIIPMPDNIFRGNLGPEERAQYGENNWYDFSVREWGSKWNSYGYDDFSKYDGGNEICFLTAWSSVQPIMGKLSEMFSDAEFEYSWADEDFGQNVGSCIWQNGEPSDIFKPEGGSKEAYELASEIMDEDVLCYGLRLNADESGYINTENERYELIELFGKPALFANERMTEADIPSGLYKCDVRGDDETTGGFAELAPSVLINHFGTIITDEPIDFGKDGFIVLTDETEPNFMGNTLTMEEYMQGEFKNTQEQNGGMNLE